MSKKIDLLHHDLPSVKQPDEGGEVEERGLES